MELQAIENKKGFKETKLGWIPEDWNVVNLSKIGTFKKGKGISKSEIKKEGLQCIRYGELYTYYDNTFKETVSFIDKETSRKSKLLAYGDVLITCSGEDRYEIGKAVAFIGSKETYAGGDLMIYNSNKLNSPYLAAFLNSSMAIKQKIALAQGYSVVHIYSSQISELNIPMPPLLEQTAIANCLSTWDIAITKLNNLIKAKQQLKKALMQHLLSGKKRLPGFSEEWEEKRIEEFADEYSQKNETNDDIEVLSCTKYDGLVPSLEYFGRQVFGDDLSKYKVVPRNYFAYATNHIEEGSIGYQDFNECGLVSPMYTVFKTNETIDDIYLFKVLKSHKLIHEYNRRMEGSIDRRGGLRWKNFRGIKLNIPPLKEQTAIAQVLNTADQEINLLINQRNQLQLQKKGLMQQLLTGKKRLKI
ncbi:restriction endonuclease subunit S [Formosa sp. PL04]|uniref:restriction endonuclease subunit S n=1 Tax=Formosa sp. PL04 TaxID=3081755 RepID=UPI002980F966|nr:restriction endonuclease subunit S [Formosa sp. PL04]MDW5289154.1 restriction endonuclease subunit S [Formosa sp. PL04]